RSAGRGPPGPRAGSSPRTGAPCRTGHSCRGGARRRPRTRSPRRRGPGPASGSPRGRRRRAGSGRGERARLRRRKRARGSRDDRHLPEARTPQRDGEPRCVEGDDDDARQGRGRQPREMPVPDLPEEEGEAGEPDRRERRDRQALGERPARDGPPGQHERGRGRGAVIEVVLSLIQARVPEPVGLVGRRIVGVAESEELRGRLDGQVRMAVQETLGQVLVMMPDVPKVAVPGCHALGGPDGRRGAGAEREPEGEPGGHGGARRGHGPVPFLASSALAASAMTAASGCQGCIFKASLASLSAVASSPTVNAARARSTWSWTNVERSPTPPILENAANPARTTENASAARRPGDQPVQNAGETSAPPARTARIAARGSRNRALTKKRRMEAAQAAATAASAIAVRGDSEAS